MASIAQLIVKISADADGLTRGIAAAQRATLSLTEKLDAAGGALTRGLTVPLGGLAALSLRSAAQFQQLERGLAAVTKEAGPLTAQLDRLKKVAELPGLGFREAVQGSINLQAAGFSANKAERALAAFGNALATVGKGRAELDGVILALSQIQSKGKVSAEEINQLAERLPQIRVALQGAFGTADSEAIQKLGLTTDQVIEKIIQQFEKLPPVTGGLANSFENLKDRGERSLAALGTAIVPIATKILDALDPVIKKVGETGEAFARLPGPIQNATLGLLGIAVVSGPILQLVKYLGDLRIAALAAYAALAKLPITFTALGGAAAGGAAAFVLLDALNNAATKTSTADANLQKLNQRLNETSQIAAGDASNSLSRFADSVFKASGVTKEAASSLQKALDLLKNPAASTTSKDLSDALETVRAAYKRGETDLKTLNAATNAYRRDAKLLGIELKETFNFQSFVNEEVFSRITSGWNKARDAVADFTTAGFNMNAQLKLHAVSFEELNPLVDRFSESLSKSFRNPLSDILKLNSQLVVLQANADITNQILAANSRSPVRNLPIPGTVGTDQALKRAGIDPQADLDAKAKAAGDLYERVNNEVKAGTRNAKDAKRAYEEWIEAEKKAAGITDKPTQAAKALAKQVSTIVTDLSRGITELIFKGGKLGDVFKNIGIQIAQSITRLAIEGGVNLLIKSLGKLLGSVLDVGGAFAKVFGGAAQTAGGVAQAAGGVGGAVGAAGSIAGKAGSSAAGVVGGLASAASIVGAVGAAVSAVFAGLQYFQGRRMEEDIGRIEVTSRGLLNDLANLRKDEWDRFSQYFTRQGEILNAVRGIYDGLSQINFSGSAAGGAGSLVFNGPVTIQTGASNGRELLADLTRQLKLQDNRFAR